MRHRFHRPALVLLALSALIAPAGARAAMSIYMTPEDLASRATRIVEGTVVETRSGLDTRTGALSTYVTLDVTAVHRGPDRSSRLILREPGGQFGDLVHEVDAVPVYQQGENVFVFLEAAADGALRTSGMFFGKFTLEATSGSAVRDLSGQGRIVKRPAAHRERMALSDLIAVAASVGPLDRTLARGRELPPEMTRLVFDKEGPEKFVALSATHPTRWDRADSGSPIVFDIERARNPLGSGAAAVFEIERAMASWTDVPESRITFAGGDTDTQFTPAHPTSPSIAVPGGANIILFGDPYDDIANSGTCSGVLAIGGYWRSTNPSTNVNGITFYPAQYGYVIFNDGLDCFLGDADNLAEVAAHELGHAIGFGHSLVPDSLMRATSYGARGPRLGDDDRDGAHCHYPHTITVTGPTGGESWASGTVAQIQWSTTPEAGPDPGTVDLEYQIDGGPWQSIATGTANDGFHAWVVPTAETASAHVRVVRPNLTTGLPAMYPAACSAGVTSAPFSIVSVPPVPGTITVEGWGGLSLDKAAGDQLRVSWSPSCSYETDNYAIYEADLGALRIGRFNPQPLTCDTGGDLVEYVAQPTGDRFYLVAPLAGGYEGGYGRGSHSPRAAPDVRCGSSVGVDYCE